VETRFVRWARACRLPVAVIAVCAAAAAVAAGARADAPTPTVSNCDGQTVQVTVSGAAAPAGAYLLLEESDGEASIAGAASSMTLKLPRGFHSLPAKFRLATTDQTGRPVFFPSEATLGPLDCLTSMDQCKQGGWKDIGVFRNQGECVSYVSTRGK
jgi:hypothetical protein